MEYAGFLLRRERLKRNWSLEGLCKGICTISYLSKIEQGKADPSQELLSQLLNQMGLEWHSADAEMTAFMDDAWETLMGFSWSMNQCFGEIFNGVDENKYLYSPFGPDYLILKSISTDANQPLDESLEACLNTRQLAFQRFLQKRFDEALHLFPCPYLYVMIGREYYGSGNIPAALELMQKGYQLAADEGYPHLMLLAQMLMGNCYSNRLDFAAMQRHYHIARRLAKSLNDIASLETIQYNIASTQLEAGEYEKALAYFSSIASPSKMDLHKMAICFEKLKLFSESAEAICRARKSAPLEWMPEDLDTRMLDLVEYRLAHPEYLKDAFYGQMLIDLFEKMRIHLPFGYAAFHLPWVLEWYESNRQYRQAYQLTRDFPGIGKNSSLND